MTRDLFLDLEAAGGLIRRAQLLRLGHSSQIIRQAIAEQVLSMPRRGWLASSSAPPEAVRAVFLGGRLGGGSALASYGIWVDDDPGLVVNCAPTASRLPPLHSGETRLWLAEVFPLSSGRVWRVSVMDALLQFSRMVPRESLIASIDSALELRKLTQRDLELLLAALPQRLQSVGRDIDGSAMSGTETRMRLALLECGYRVRSQVYIPGVGTVDLLVDDWLIIELDSRGHHESRVAQARDRARDGNAVLIRYGHERFMWEQVRYEIDWCLSVVAERLRDGRPEHAPLRRSQLLVVPR